jgi:hypothetical protein
MKKLAMMTLALMASCVCAFSEEIPETLRVINVSNVTFEDDFEGFILGQYPDVAIEFSAQTILPLNFFLKGDLLSLVGDNKNVGMLQVQQTFYARAVVVKDDDEEGVEFMLSTNLVDWKEFSDFVTGYLTVNLNVENGQPLIVFGAEVNKDESL